MSGDMSNNPDTKPASYPQDSSGRDQTASAPLATQRRSGNTGLLGSGKSAYAKRYW
jgi:hypothetical protein